MTPSVNSGGGSFIEAVLRQSVMSTLRYDDKHRASHWTNLKKKGFCFDLHQSRLSKTHLLKLQEVKLKLNCLPLVGCQCSENPVFGYSAVCWKKKNCVILFSCKNRSTVSGTAVFSGDGCVNCNLAQISTFVPVENALSCCMSTHKTCLLFILH